MATGTIQLRAVGFERVSARLGRQIRVAANPMQQIGTQAVGIIRDQIRKEFIAGAWFSPSGGRVPWKPTKPFGNRPAPTTPLGGASGGLAKAWAGGRGGFSKITARTVTVGVNRPDAVVHRGGRGSRVSANAKTVIKAKRIGTRGLPAMYWFLGMRFGVWISPTKLRQGIVVPARPHATRHPELVRRLGDVMAEAIVNA